MTSATIEAPHRTRWNVSAAVLVYEAAGGDSAYAVIHDVETNGKRLRLGAGKPATKEASAAFARTLGAASTLSGFLPADLLYLGARTLVWWRRPRTATMHFDTTKQAAGDQQEDKARAKLIGKRGGRAQQPGLVFAVTPGRWYVYAVKGTERPGPSASIFRAPYFNVWKNGAICTGNVKLPDSLSTSALERYERAFFGSEFTHPNVQGSERLVAHPAGSYTFWKERLDQPDMPFPESALVSEKVTLEALVKRLEKGGRDV